LNSKETDQDDREPKEKMQARIKTDKRKIWVWCTWDYIEKNQDKILALDHNSLHPRLK